MLNADPDPQYCFIVVKSLFVFVLIFSPAGDRRLDFIDYFYVMEGVVSLLWKPLLSCREEAPLML
jgi:hypothetical protein